MQTLKKIIVGMTSLLCLVMANATTTTLRINGRAIVLPTDTQVLIDDQPGQLWQLIGKPAGMQLNWPAQSLRGAPTLVFSYTLIGPVTRLEPLEVLGQPITLTGDTVREGFSQSSELVIGAPMLLAGLVDQNGSLYSTLAVRRGAQGNKYLLSGYVQELLSTQARIRIGQQWLSTAGVTFSGCATPLPAVGSYVEIRADPVANFQPGDTLTTVRSARCANAVAVGTPGAVGVLDGLVDAPTNTGFKLGTLQVRISANTEFLYGMLDDLDIGVEVVVEGVFFDANTLDATLVEFVRPAVRFEVPMTPAEITPNVAVRPFGVTVLANAQMRDDENILGAGLAQARQVQVRGWLDRFGVAHLARVRTRGNPDAGDVSLRAPIATIAAPLITAQGLSIDTTGATFFDANQTPISANAFFSALRVNHVIDVSGASWTPATRTLRGGVIVLLGFEHTQPVPPPSGASISGTVNDFGTESSLFRSGFE